MKIESLCLEYGPVKFPEFSGLRIMMMPFEVSDPIGSLPSNLFGYAKIVGSLACADSGVGYLTVDEAIVNAGEYHRRPGLHVDGGVDDSYGGWGGGGGGWGGGSGKVWGFAVAASQPGCTVYPGVIHDYPGEDGDCDHFRDNLPPGQELRPNTAYWMSPLAVHETLPQKVTAPRQFLRVSMPSTAPWYEGYTPNPLGILPAGPIMPRRAKQMAHRI